MNPIDLNDYVVGGYFVAKHATKGFGGSPLLPERVLSISKCFGKLLQTISTEPPQKARLDAAEFGIRESDYDEYRDWVGEHVQGIFSEFQNLEEGRQTILRWVPKDYPVLLVAAGLHREMIVEFLTYKPYPDVHPNYEVFHAPLYDEDQRRILAGHRVNDRELLPEGGIPLGYEVLSLTFGDLGHSWLCYGVHDVMHKLHGIRPNQHGLIDTYAEAKQVYEWIAEDKMQGTRAEPFPFYPWLIVQYPVNRGS